MELAESLQAFVSCRNTRPNSFCRVPVLHCGLESRRGLPGFAMTTRRYKNRHLQQTPALSLPTIQARDLCPLALRCIVFVLVGDWWWADRLLWSICFHA
jgi:hypothetical protein